MTLGNVTAYGNSTVQGGMIRVLGSQSSARVLSSVFDQNPGPLFGTVVTGSNIQVDCVLAEAVNSFGTLPPATQARAIYNADPRLANPLAGNY